MFSALILKNQQEIAYCPPTLQQARAAMHASFIGVSLCVVSRSESLHITITVTHNIAPFLLSGYDFRASYLQQQT